MFHPQSFGELVDARAKHNILALCQLSVDFSRCVPWLRHKDSAEVPELLLCQREVHSAAGICDRGNSQAVAPIRRFHNEGLLCNHLRARHVAVHWRHRVAAMAAMAWRVRCARAADEDEVPGTFLPGFGNAVPGKELLLRAQVHVSVHLHIGHVATTCEITNGVSVAQLYPAVVVQSYALLWIPGVFGTNTCWRQAQVPQEEVMVHHHSSQRCCL
mmetsp:Transcript_68693/g.108209  ORF Transcript_68693/g.108209 Transcript_68693/m.108209 type:complete len:215 (+) Transcript_68693:1171-1815(+)